MRHNIPTCSKPKDPNALYMRNMYKEFFWGPFNDEKAVIDAIKILDTADPHWDYEPFCIIYGADPLPDDFVFGFPFVSKDMKERILAASKHK